jgi:hypothetical protein
MEKEFMKTCIVLVTIDTGPSSPAGATVVLAVEGIWCLYALPLGIYLNAYETKSRGFIAVCSLRRFDGCVIALRVFREPAVLWTYNQDVVCYVLIH